MHFFYQCHIRVFPLKRLVEGVSALLTYVLGWVVRKILIFCRWVVRKILGGWWLHQTYMAEILWVDGPKNFAILGVGGPKKLRFWGWVVRKKIADTPTTNFFNGISLSIWVHHDCQWLTPYSHMM